MLQKYCFLQISPNNWDNLHKNVMNNLVNSLICGIFAA